MTTLHSRIKKVNEKELWEASQPVHIVTFTCETLFQPGLVEDSTTLNFICDVITVTKEL